MGTNFYLRRVKPVEAYPEMHIAKRSAGWRIHFQDSTEGVEPCYFDDVDAPTFHSVREIRAVLERGEWQLADEYGDTWEPVEESLREFDKLCKWRGGPQFEGMPVGRYPDEEPPYEHTGGYVDPEGYQFTSTYFR